MKKTYGTPKIGAEASVNAQTLAMLSATNTEASVPSKRL
jgi:hypothetical protein